MYLHFSVILTDLSPIFTPISALISSLSPALYCTVVLVTVATSQSWPKLHTETKDCVAIYTVKIKIAGQSNFVPISGKNNVNNKK